MQDDIDKIDHEAMYPNAEDSLSDSPPDLEETDSVNTAVYNRQEASPTSTAVSTDTEAACDMHNLTMGPRNPASKENHAPTDGSDEDDNQLEDMSRPRLLGPLPVKPWLDPRALMAEAKLRSGCRTLPPPLGVRRCLDDLDSDTRNVVLQAIRMPVLTDTQVRGRQSLEHRSIGSGPGCE